MLLFIFETLLKRNNFLYSFKYDGHFKCASRIDKFVFLKKLIFGLIGLKEYRPAKRIVLVSSLKKCEKTIEWKPRIQW